MRTDLMDSLETSRIFRSHKGEMSVILYVSDAVAKVLSPKAERERSEGDEVDLLIQSVRVLPALIDWNRALAVDTLCPGTSWSWMRSRRKELQCPCYYRGRELRERRQTVRVTRDVAMPEARWRPNASRREPEEPLSATFSPLCDNLPGAPQPPLADHAPFGPL